MVNIAVQKISIKTVFFVTFFLIAKTDVVILFDIKSIIADANDIPNIKSIIHKTIVVMVSAKLPTL